MPALSVSPPDQPGPVHSLLEVVATSMFRNSLKTAVLLAGLGGFLVLIGSFFGRAGTLIGLAVGLVVVGGSYWFSDKLAIRAAGGRPLDPHELPWLHADVAELAVRRRSSGRSALNNPTRPAATSARPHRATRGRPTHTSGATPGCPRPVVTTFGSLWRSMTGPTPTPRRGGPRDDADHRDGSGHHRTDPTRKGTPHAPRLR